MIVTMSPTCTRRAIEANDPAAPFAANSIGLESLAVVIVHDLHFLSFQYLPILAAHMND